MTRSDLPASVLERRAIVYVRQSTTAQVQENLESQRRQYDLANSAREFGFSDVKVIDDDLGRSASSTSDRPGFRTLVAEICAGIVGAVFCLDASRLARNGRDWHHLLELCGLVGARVIDVEGVYDPSQPNDRLLLGLKGTMSEFELTILRRRLLDAVVAKAKRGELRIPVPVGYVWHADTGLAVDPDRRVQSLIRSIFTLFDRFGSARQVLLHMVKEGLTFPRPAGGKVATTITWRAPIYRNVIAVLQNPFYAGAYCYGKSRTMTTIVDGTMVKSAKGRPMSEWTALLRDHHEAYVSWEQFERNQERLSRNSFCKSSGGAKSGRGGQALMAGLLRCRRCGRMLHVTYGGRGIRKLARYTCRTGNAMHGLDPCITFGARRPDDSIVHELLLAVQPLAIDAALVAERDAVHRVDEKRRALELELQQAKYEVQLALRRYEAVDPDNRLVAAELEQRWNAALTRQRACEARIEAVSLCAAPRIERDQLLDLAADLERAWHAPTTTTRTKQQLVRSLVQEIVVDVDDSTREVVLMIHWRGGHHSELRVQKPESGEHTKRASDEAVGVIREMSTKWSDEEIAATLNRMRVTTGQGNTWTCQRVAACRTSAGIRAYESANKDGRCLTMLEAAQKCGVSCHAIRRLIKTGILPARQVVFDAPWQILAADLERAEVQDALCRRRTRRGRPCRNSKDERTLVIPGT